MSSVSNEPQTSSVWSRVASYAVPPAAAAAAIVPTYYGFVVKSALQTGQPFPSMTMREALMGGFKAAPTIGTIVGTQLLVDEYVGKQIAMFLRERGVDSELAAKFLSAVVVGAVSVPPLVVFNGQTMKQTAWESLMALSLKQAAAVVTRESTFVFSLGASAFVKAKMSEFAGENKAVEYGSAFVSGVIGSVVGHPADTALTLWQKKMEVEGLRQLMRGGLYKAGAVGVFSALYTGLKKGLGSTRVDEG
ncbi:MAG: hypothetical protein V4492_00550 [Chlamydiota bacterium]